MRVGNGAPLPYCVAFEGVDGVGKTTFVSYFAELLRAGFPDRPYFSGRATGMRERSFGTWAYHLRHGRAAGVAWPSTDVGFLTRDDLAPVTIELTHLIAQLDAITNEILPVLAGGGWAVVDRCWLSIYAELRQHLPRDDVMSLTAPLRRRWAELPALHVVYLRRASGRLPQAEHDRLDASFQEAAGIGGDQVIEVWNDDDLDGVGHAIAGKLGLPGLTADASGGGRQPW